MPRRLAILLLLAAGPLAEAAPQDGIHAPLRAEPVREAPGADRERIVQAQQQIHARYGGRRIDQRWRQGQLYWVWRTGAGDTRLIRVNPETGQWQTVGDAHPDR